MSSCRFSKARLVYKKSLLLRKVFRNWKQYSFSTKFTKQAFLHRMELFLRRFHLSKGFELFCILRRRRKIAEEIARQRSCCLLKSYYQQWSSLSAGRATARHCIGSLVNVLYKRLMPQYFLIWKVKVSCGLRLGQSVLAQRALQRWKHLYIATRYDRVLSMMRVFNAWNELIAAKKNNIQWFRKRRSCGFDIVSRLVNNKPYALIYSSVILLYHCRTRHTYFLKLKSTLIDWKSLQEGQKENTLPEINRL